MDARKISQELHTFGSPSKARILQGFFKTGPGQYGEGDVFIGVTVPKTRALAKKYADTSFADLKCLLHSQFHEERLLSLLILVDQYERGDAKKKKKVFDFYMRHRKFINNWDLVDLTAHHIVGDYLKDKDKALLTRLAWSEDLWERRIAMVATFHYIYEGKHEWTFKIAEILMRDRHDLIHKATGWMLREVGKRCSQPKLEEFLRKHAPKMPRTALRYAIERFPHAKRRKYLNQTE